LGLSIIANEAPCSKAWFVKVLASKCSPFMATNIEFLLIFRVSVETELHFKNSL